MRVINPLFGLAIALAAGAAAAQPAGENPPATAVICLDVSGRTMPVTCHAQASRTDQRYDICQCFRGGTPVTVSVCPAGVSPPAESAAYERARRDAVRGGSIVGALFQGQPMCVAPRQSQASRY